MFNVISQSDQIRSVAQLCPTLCDPMNPSTPGLPVHHQLLELTQTHVHRVSDAIQPSHPLSSPSSLAPNPSQHQSLFQGVNSLHEVAKVGKCKSSLQWDQAYKATSHPLGQLEQKRQAITSVCEDVVRLEPSSSLRWYKCSRITEWWWLPSHVNILKLTELYTLQSI